MGVRSEDDDCELVGVRTSEWDRFISPAVVVAVVVIVVGVIGFTPSSNEDAGESGGEGESDESIAG